MTKFRIPNPESRIPNGDLSAVAHRAKVERGMTLVEATVILAVVSTLAAILAPGINGYIEQARAARARNDVQTISEAIETYVTDTALHQFLRDGNGASAKAPPDFVADDNRVHLLVSDGDIPSRSSVLVAASDSFWTLPVTGTSVDTLSNHLVENKPGEDSAKQYRNTTDINLLSSGNQNIDFARTASSGLNAPHAWRGPYLRGPVGSDPWGNRYAVNVAFLDTAHNVDLSTFGLPFSFGLNDYPRLDVFVLSAGPDEELDTHSAQDGAVPGDDDVMYLVSSHAK